MAHACFLENAVPRLNYIGTTHLKQGAANEYPRHIFVEKYKNVNILVQNISYDNIKYHFINIYHYEYMPIQIY